MNRRPQVTRRTSYSRGSHIRIYGEEGVIRVRIAIRPYMLEDTYEPTRRAAQPP